MGEVTAAPGDQASGAELLEWHFSQVFGERSPGEDVQDGEDAIRAQLSRTAVSLRTQPGAARPPLPRQHRTNKEFRATVSR